MQEKLRNVLFCNLWKQWLLGSTSCYGGKQALHSGRPQLIESDGKRQHVNEKQAEAQRTRLSKQKCVSDSDSSPREPCDKKTPARPVTHSKSSEMKFMMDLRHCKSISWSAMSESLQPMDNRPPGSSIHGISQARILEWVPISFSKGSSQSRDQTNVSCTGRQILYHWATREASKPCPNHELNVHSDQWV